MNIPKFHEKRKLRRKHLTGLLPGKITMAGDSQSISCQPVDISEHGLGIVTNLILKVGTQLEIHLKEESVKLEVSWGQPDFAKKDLYRYGLQIVSEPLDLKKIFEKTGCLQ